MRRSLIGALLVVAIVVILCVRAEEPGAGSSSKTISVGGVTRNYILHEPANRKGDAKLPLVIVLHGGYGNSAQAERSMKFSPLADKENFIVVYPNGITRHWNDGRGSASESESDADDVGFISALIDELIKSHVVDPKRVFATGISNGAIMSQHLAVQLADKIAAVGSVCGLISNGDDAKFSPARPVSVLFMNGTADPLVKWDGGDVGKRGTVISTDASVKRWIEFDHCDAKAIEDAPIDNDPNDSTRVLRYTYKNGKDGTEVVLLKIEGGGHTWPKGESHLPEKLVGKTSQEIDATAVIWEFFKAHPRN
jgi:polyhydroxybutyrate depolymerase